jgi:uncharacterized protein
MCSGHCALLLLRQETCALGRLSFNILKIPADRPPQYRDFMIDPSVLAANKALALEFLEHAVAYRVEECMALMSSTATWWVQGNPARLRVAGMKDRTQLRRLLVGLSQYIPQPMRLVVNGVTAEEGRVAIEAVCAGLWRNGATYRNTYHFLIEIEKGAIVAVREYMDTLSLFDLTQMETQTKA